MKRASLLTALAGLAIPAHADLYKCKGADGKLTYQGTPCQSESEASTIRTPSVRQEDAEAAQIRAKKEIQETTRKEPPKADYEQLGTPEERRAEEIGLQRYLECERNKRAGFRTSGFCTKAV